MLVVTGVHVADNIDMSLTTALKLTNVPSTS